MLTKIVSYALAAVVAASPVLAESQLERSLGVPAGVYSAAQLVDLRNAIESGERSRAAHIIRSGANGGVTRDTMNFTADGHSFGERQIIANALEDNRFQNARFVAGGGLGRHVGGEEIMKARVASDLGVNPEGYTLSRLYKLQDENQE
ncbi:hypothetical protein [Roseitranquillus sediminis]|uniref:hypothetical protein n=1 Tax=Roseitranquillus sediminis TaxID=2809051 RepID=UPI001D0C64FB|nr:hypothetical protein [Roseitranquillus sediminis]MBM9593009.1 hypothetical protein [Roseitranquillus sediminis]